MLVRTPRPIPCESPFGYLLRLSEANGYASPSTVLEYAGFRFYQRIVKFMDMEKLSSVVGWPKSELYALSHAGARPSIKSLTKVMGHRLENIGQALRWDRSYICPACVLEQGYIDVFWDLQLALACPIHKCKPLMNCPSCRKSITWFRPGLLVCRCGCELGSAEPAGVSLEISEVLSLVYAKLHGETLLGRPNPLGFPLEDLDRTHFSSLLGIVTDLATRGEAGSTYRKPLTYSALHRAGTALANFPSEYHAFLRRIGGGYRREASSQSSIKKQFKRFYEPMFKYGYPSHDADFLKREFVNFGLTKWGHAIVDPRMLRKYRKAEVERPRFLSMSAYARNIGVRPITLRHWAERGLISFHTVNTPDQVRHIVDTREIGLVKQSAGKMVNCREAAAYLGVPVAVLRSLRASGHFKLAHMPRYKRGYHEEDLKVFRRRLIECASTPNRESKCNDFVSLQYIMQEMRFWSCEGKAAFIAAYLDGKIRGTTGRDESLGGIKFCLSDVNSYARASRRTASDGAVSQREAAAHLHCDPTAIPGLIEKGLLVGVPGPNRVRVDTKSLDSFAGDYIALVVIARKRRTSVTRLLRLSRNAGIEVLSIPRRRRSNVPFIRCQDEQSLVKLTSTHPPRRVIRRMQASQRAGVLSKLQAYLRELEERDLELPRRVGVPSKAVIARACGFDRNAFYVNVEARTMLAEADEADKRRNRMTSSST